MSTTLGIVEVPAALTQSHDDKGPPVLLAARRFCGKSLLEWVVRRVTESLLLDQVAVLTDASQGELVRRLAPSDVPVVISDHPDSLGRCNFVSRQFEATYLVRVPLSCPFIDPELIDRLVCTAGANPGCDYIGYFSMDGRPAVVSKVGLFAEWCRVKALARADRCATTRRDREEPTRYIYSHAEEFHAAIHTRPIEA